jgi:glucose/arabinose dehydrogenase
MYADRGNPAHVRLAAMMHRMTTRLRLAAIATVALLSVTACGDDEPTTGTASSAPQTSASVSGTAVEATDPEGPAEVVLTGSVVAELDEPIALLPRPGDDLVWVAERAGTIRRLEKAPTGELSPVGEPVLDITDQTSTESERGLLGMAFSIDGSVLYVSHTDADGNSRVASYDVVDETVDAGTRTELLLVEQPFPNHNGGHIVVTPEDDLWLGLGDGGAADDPENRAQDPDTLLGKLVRVDTSGGADHQIVASGLRNPWRFSLADDGMVWIADVGQNAIEEINRIPEEDLAGSNFGWSGYEGNEPYLDGDGRRPADPVMPVFTYTHDGGNCSITGGFTVQGDDLGLEGAYLFADYCAGQVRALVPGAEGSLSERDLGIDVAGPVSFGTDADGDAYVLSAEGSVVRIEIVS